MGRGAVRRGWWLVVVLVLSGCSGSAGPTNADLRVPAPTGLASGCPPPSTALRYAGGDLPEGAVAVRLCPGQPTIAYTGEPLGPPIQVPLDQLTTAADVAALVKLVNGLPDAPRDQACHLDDGPHHMYWFRYPDGDARAVAYDEAGCHVALVGKDAARQDGEQLATAFADALLAQRAGAPVPAAAGVEAPSCQPPPWSMSTSVLPVASVETGMGLTDATWCVAVGPHRMRSADVPARLLRRIDAGLLVAPEEGRDRCKPEAYGRWLVGATAWGDRMSFDVFGCRVVARTGFGRDHMTTVFETDPELLAALRGLPLSPVTRWDGKE